MFPANWLPRHTNKEVHVLFHQSRLFCARHPAAVLMDVDIKTGGEGFHGHAIVKPKRC